MTDEPRDHYVGEGGDGTDPQLPDSIPDPEPDGPPDAQPDGPDIEEADHDPRT